MNRCNRGPDRACRNLEFRRLSLRKAPFCDRMRLLLGLGRRQAERQRPLEPPFGGSNPPAPAFIYYRTVSWSSVSANGFLSNSISKASLIGLKKASTHVPSGIRLLFFWQAVIERTSGLAHGAGGTGELPVVSSPGE